MINFLYDLFHWPDGIVVGNLIASAIWAPLTFIHLHRKIDRNHREHMKAIQKGKENGANGN